MSVSSVITASHHLPSPPTTSHHRLPSLPHLRRREEPWIRPGITSEAELKTAGVCYRRLCSLCRTVSARYRQYLRLTTLPEAADGRLMTVEG